MRVDINQLGPEAKRQVLRQLAVQSAPKGNKYGAIKTPRKLPDGSEHVFDSRKEAERYDQLRYMENQGLIEDLRIQVRYELLPKQKGKHRDESPAYYVADFVYKAGGEEVVEDCKGKRTDTYILKRKLMLLLHGISILET